MKTTKANLHLERVSFTFPSLSTVKQDGGGGGGVGVGQHHRVKVDPDFANVAARFADCVGARISIRAGELVFQNLEFIKI